MSQHDNKSTNSRSSEEKLNTNVIEEQEFDLTNCIDTLFKSESRDDVREDVDLSNSDSADSDIYDSLLDPTVNTDDLIFEKEKISLEVLKSSSQSNTPDDECEECNFTNFLNEK